MIDPTSVYWDDWLLLGLQGLTLIALVFYVWKTSHIARGTITMAEEAKAARDASLAPRVVIYFDPTEVYFAHFVLENVGAGTAADARFDFDPPLQSAERFGGTEFFTTPKVLPPGYRLVHLFDSWRAYLQSSLPMRYQVTITFRGVENGQTYRYIHELDLESFRHRHGLRRHGIHELVDRVEKLERCLNAGLANIQRQATALAVQSQLHVESRSLHEALAAFATLYATFRVTNESEGRVYIDWGGGVAALRTAAINVSAAAASSGASPAFRESVQRLVLVLFHETHLGDQEWLPRLNTAVDHVDALLPSVQGSVQLPRLRLLEDTESTGPLAN